MSRKVGSSLLQKLISNKNSLVKKWATSDSSWKTGQGTGKCPEKPEGHSLAVCCDVEPCNLNGEECRISEGVPKPRVVILGAGIAGLSAAQRLIENGIQNVIVLEAKERPGGRIHSCRFGEGVAEMGAGWIEGGCMANPVYNLAGVEGLLGQNVKRRRNIWDGGTFLMSEGRALRGNKAAAETIKRLQHEAFSLFSRAKGSSYGSLMDFFKTRIEAEVKQLPEEERDDAKKIFHSFANEIRARWGEDLTQMSADGYGSFIDIPGGQVLLPLGVAGLLAPLMRCLASPMIKYSKIVQQVIYSSRSTSDCRALVKCCDGEAIPADYVIVTFSLGVLKSQASQLFCPALPAEKIAAIRSLGYGHVDKIYIQYQMPFWTRGEGRLRPAWSEPELAERSDWVKGIGKIEEAPDMANTLCVTVGGKEAIAMEGCSDSQVVEDLTNFLRSITGDPSLPCPKGMIRSKWSEDLLFLGASSFMGLDSNVGHQCDLASPLPPPSEPTPPTILFAGEATTPGYFSTLHGARISGIREADRIIGLTSFYNGPPPNE